MFTSTLTLTDGTPRSLVRSMVIGRAPESAPAVVEGAAEPLVIEDDSQLSRHHLQLTVDDVGLTVTDLGSGNGTAVERDGTRHDLESMTPMELRSGDVLLFGRQRGIVGLDAAFDATVIVGGEAAGDDPTPPSTPAAPPAPASPATTVLPPRATPPPAQPAPPQPAPPQPAPPQSAPPQSAPPPGNFVPGRADAAAGAPGFDPGRAVPPPVSAGAYGHPGDAQSGRDRASAMPASFGARLWGTILDSVIYGLVMIAVIVLAVLGFYIHPAIGSLIGVVGYFGLFFLYWRQVATTGQSWGRRIAKVRVVDARTGQPIGYWKTFLRFFVANISGSIFYLGYLWMLWDDKQQTWHDKAAGSVVISV